jgi:hypothetical protein
MPEPKDVHPGTVVKFRTTPFDVETIYVDGVRGIMVNAGLTKISFFEQILDSESAGDILGRHAVTLAIPNEQLRPIVDVLTKVADDNDERLQQPAHVK